jgi:hypothetical protein
MIPADREMIGLAPPRTSGGRSWRDRAWTLIHAQGRLVDHIPLRHAAASDWQAAQLEAAGELGFPVVWTAHGPGFRGERA